MSNRTYERLWREADEDVRKVLEEDKAYVAEDVIEDRPRAFKQAATNYIRYSMCVNKLNLCLDQMIHVHKRQTVRTLLEATLARTLQVKQELVNMDMSDFSYLDGVLMDMKLTPYDVEIQVPKFYRRDREEKIKKMNSDIDRILYELENPPTPPDEELEDEDEDHLEEDGKKEDKDVEPVKEPRSATRLKPRQGSDAMKEPRTTTEPVKEPKTAAKMRPAGDGDALDAKKRKGSANPNWPPMFKKVELTESQKMFKEIIFLIQKHERARVARRQTQELKEKQRIQHDIAWLIYQPIPEDVQDWSVRLIQRFWRGYNCRHREWNKRTRGRLLMGELTPSWRSHEAQDRARAVEEERRQRQEVADEEFSRAVEELEKKIRRAWREEDVMDDIADHLRWYIEDWYRRIGELPEFPEPTKILPDELLGFPKDTPAEFKKRMVKEVPVASLYYPGIPPHLLGGSALIVAGYWIDPGLYEIAHKVAQLAKGKGGAKQPEKKEKLTKQQLKEKKEEEKEKKRLEKEKAQKDLEEKLKRGVVPNPTELLEPLTRHLDMASIQWGEYHDLEWNPAQRHRDDIPAQLISYDQHSELREVVDELMRLEIERLQEALNKDRGKKSKPGKKKKKGKAKKPKKDLTHDRTPESLFKELVEKGIIRKSEDVRIDSLFCQPSWNNYDLRRDPWWQNPQPNLWDVKQVVKEYCILPLGSATVHSAAPLVRSVLLAGYPDCGKRLLMDAVAAETGAVVFDLSPQNTVGKYEGRKGLNMLVHLVTKMSRILQPSVVLLEGGEKPFYKKVPKAERQDNPKLLKKHLPKMVKTITAEDRVLFVATAENPWMGQAKTIAKTYNKIVPILPLDQSTAASYWHHRLMEYHGVARDFLYSPLVWCAQGFTIPVIDKVISSLLTADRIVSLKYRPLDPQEILDKLLLETPVTEDQQKKLLDWYSSTYSMARRREEKAKVDKELRDKLAAIEAKKKEQQKKKK